MLAGVEKRSWSFALAFLVGVGVSRSSGAVQEGERPPVRHALLVGCSEYPSLRAALGKQYESELVLRGPERDVELVRDTLEHVLRLAPQHTRVLAGWKDDVATRPTHDNILAQLERLALEAGTGDQVIVYLAGHGSQQRVRKLKTEEEPDGLEELFLPADVRPAEKDQGHVPNSIRDDELGMHARAIRDKGADVWLIVDACHSGTLLRGGAGPESQGGVRIRGIDPALLGVTSELRGGPGARSDGGGWLDPAGETTRIAAFYGATSYGRAPEMMLPRGSTEAEPHGLFTYLFCQELQRAGPETTYGELADRVVAAYQSFPCVLTVPTAEGDLPRDLAGGLPRDTELTCSLKSGVLFLSQGRLAGLEPGVELALLDLAGGTERLAGRMVVTESSLFDARGKLLSGELAMEKGPWRARADARPLGDYGLALALVRADGTAAAMDELPAAARAALEAQAARFRIVGDPGTADWWIVLAHDGGLLLRPGPREGGFDVFGVGAEDLAARLTAIQRTRNLRRFAGSSFTAEWRDDLDVWVERRTARGWQRRERDSVLRPGEAIKVLMQKKTDAIYDVNVFYLDANYGVQCLRQSPRLAPTAREAIDLVGVQTITDDALGLENVLVFATPRTQASREVQLCPVIEQRGLLRGSAPDPFAELIEAVASGETMRSGPVRVADAGGTQSMLETLRTEWGELAPPPWPQALTLVERPRRDGKEDRVPGRTAGAEEPPDPWGFGTRAALARSGESGPFDLLLLGTTEVEVVLVDFDPPAAPAGASVAELVAQRKFDAEAAFGFGACRMAWYDRADRGVFDLALEDANADGVAESRWSRMGDAGSSWQRESRVALPWLSQAYVAPGMRRSPKEKVAVSARLQALQRPP